VGRYLVQVYNESGGRVTLRICRRKTDDHEADSAPLPLTHGTLDITLTDHEMSDLHSATGEALWQKLFAK
jgi:hypothetical protein